MYVQTIKWLEISCLSNEKLTIVPIFSLSKCCPNPTEFAIKMNKKFNNYQWHQRVPTNGLAIWSKIRGYHVTGTIVQRRLKVEIKLFFMKNQEKGAQCGNFKNLLSPLFSQKFREIKWFRIKFTLAVFTKYFSSESKFLDFPHCGGRPASPKVH